jgi:hypothetical protein
MTSHLRQHYPQMQAMAHQLSRDERREERRGSGKEKDQHFSRLPSSLYWLLLSSVQKKGLGQDGYSFPLARNSMEGQGEPGLLTREREEDSIRQAQRILRSGSQRKSYRTGSLLA